MLGHKHQNLLEPEDKISLSSRTKPGNFKSGIPATMGGGEVCVMRRLFSTPEEVGVCHAGE